MGVLTSWFTWRMAWRDCRGRRRRLLLYVSAITLGVAALVAIQSTRDSLREAVSRQARELVGADLTVGSRRPLPDKVTALLDAADADQAYETAFSSMLSFPALERSHLVYVRAIEGGFPWYGKLETEPPEAATAYQTQRGALVDESLMLQVGAHIGDEVRLGKATFRIVGRLVRVPGEMALLSQLAPRVFIPRDMVAATGLVQTGSRVRYQRHLRLRHAADLPALTAALEPYHNSDGLRIRTVEHRQEHMGRSIRNVTRFLSMFGLAALLLGGIGIGSAMTVYMRQKMASVAILRCLGATGRQTVAIYVAQTLTLGGIGAVAGALLGAGVTRLLPVAIADFLPVTIQPRISWTAVGTGLGLGIAMTVIFSLLPLLELRGVSPLLALRAGLERRRRRPTLSQAGIWLGMAAGLYLFTAWALESWRYGAAFAGAILVLFGILAGVARLLVWVLRRVVRHGWPFIWRQGLGNLHRPHNQTLVLMLALSLGTFLLATLVLVQQTLLGQLTGSRDPDAPNLVMFDIQPDQLAPLQQLVRDQGLPVVESVPLITMRIRSINGKTVSQLREQKEPKLERWALNREYRSTFRDHLVSGEELVEGSFVPHGSLEIEPIPVTVEKGLEDELKVKLGDEIVWDVQGLDLRTKIVGVREVDWYRLQPNFFFVFPTGVLEDAPQIHVVTTRVPEAAARARLQQAVLDRFPNVSVLDVSMVADTLDKLFSRLAFAIRFMSIFCLATGAIVLIGSVSTSRHQRRREQALLRTLGSSRGQIRGITVIEFVLLGGIGAASGIACAVAASWGLARFWFETRWVVSPAPLVWAWVVVVVITVGLGLLNARGVLRHAPLEVLREE